MPATLNRAGLLGTEGGPGPADASADGGQPLARPHQLHEPGKPTSRCRDQPLQSSATSESWEHRALRLWPERQGCSVRVRRSTSRIFLIDNLSAGIGHLLVARKADQLIRLSTGAISTPPSPAVRNHRIAVRLALEPVSALNRIPQNAFVVICIPTEPSHNARLMRNPLISVCFHFDLSNRFFSFA
jgi:hypothetical protein